MEIVVLYDTLEGYESYHEGNFSCAELWALILHQQNIGVDARTFIQYDTIIFYQQIIYL